MTSLLEQYKDTSATKDGGFVFQAVLSHSIKWEIVSGVLKFDPKKINCRLHKIDVFPDLRFTAGSATSTYVILSEVNILKRKFELATEAIKKRINLEYAAELEELGTSGTSELKKSEINQKYFKDTYFEAELKTNNIVLREVSSSGLDSGSASATLKLSTGLVNTLDGKPTGAWENITLEVAGTRRLVLNNSTAEKLSEIRERDEIDNSSDPIFRTIVPSLVLDFKGDRVTIDSFSNRSADVAVASLINYDNLFVNDIKTKPSEITKAQNK